MKGVTSKFLLFVTVSVLLLWIILIGYSNNSVNDLQNQDFQCKREKTEDSRNTWKHHNVKAELKSQYERSIPTYIDSYPTSLRRQHLKASSVR